MLKIKRLLPGYWKGGLRELEMVEREQLASKTGGADVTLYRYSIVIWYMASARCRREAFAILDRVRAAGVAIDAYCLNGAIDACS